eukprot:2215500-Alexandrium_andersonii.AAC.1
MRSRPVSAATRLDPQSALPNIQDCFVRSQLELRGTQHGFKIGPRSSQGAHSASLAPRRRTAGHNTPDTAYGH